MQIKIDCVSLLTDCGVKVSQVSVFHWTWEGGGGHRDIGGHWK